MANSKPKRLKAQERYLVSEQKQLPQNVLPNTKEVLGFLLFNTGTLKKCLVVSCNDIATELMNVYAKARIPTQLSQNIVNKLKKVHEEWRDIQRGGHHRSSAQIKREETFLSKLDCLFEIAHAKAMTLIKIEEDKLFLEAQREVPRRGRMSGVDLALAAKEERSAHRQQLADSREARENLRVATRNAAESALLSSDETPNVTESLDLDQEFVSASSSVVAESSTKRGTEKILDRDLSAALDRAGVTDNQAAIVLTATLRRFKKDPVDFNCNRSSLRRDRIEFRHECTTAIQAKIGDLPSYVVHWDGKIMPDIVGHSKVDRLPVIVTGLHADQLLGVPKLEHGTGAAQAQAVFAQLEKSGLSNKVQAMCTDTESANTGSVNGACVRLEQLLERDLLYFACRHHMYEVTLGGLFQKFVTPTNGPDINIFVRFRDAWKSINAVGYQDFRTDPIANAALQDERESILAFLMEKLEEDHARDDYQELLELSVIFLDGQPQRGVHFRTPGPVSDARWMMKAIYALRMFPFREQFHLSQRQLRGIVDLCIFVTLVYVRAWFNAPAAINAPRQDLMFMKQLLAYKEINPSVAAEAIRKFSGHLWYLSEECAALAFFDSQVPAETKVKMVRALEEAPGEEEPSRRAVYHQRDEEYWATRELESLLTNRSTRFFERFGIAADFLKHDPSTWDEDESYRAAHAIVSQLRVVNDTTERGVKLIQEYNRRISNDEDEKQFLLTLVHAHRQ